MALHPCLICSAHSRQELVVDCTAKGFGVSVRRSGGRSNVRLTVIVVGKLLLDAVEVVQGIWKICMASVLCPLCALERSPYRER